GVGKGVGAGEKKGKGWQLNMWGRRGRGVWEGGGGGGGGNFSSRRCSGPGRSRPLQCSGGGGAISPVSDARVWSLVASSHGATAGRCAFPVGGEKSTPLSPATLQHPAPLRPQVIVEYDVKLIEYRCSGSCDALQHSGKGARAATKTPTGLPRGHRRCCLQGDPRVQTKNRQTLPKTLPGVVCAQWVRCGRANCRCARGQLHGPYHYRFFRVGGRLKKEYVRPAELEEVRARCEARRQARRDLRAAWDTWRLMRAAVRQVE